MQQLSLPNHWTRQLFLAQLAAELQQAKPGEDIEDRFRGLSEVFPRSVYMLAQRAMACYLERCAEPGRARGSRRPRDKCTAGPEAEEAKIRGQFCKSNSGLNSLKIGSRPLSNAAQGQRDGEGAL